MSFINSSYYIFPISTEAKETVDAFLAADAGWCPVEEEQVNCNYLYNYVSRIISKRENCEIYRYEKYSTLPVYMFENELKTEEKPQISEISLL